MMTNAHKEKLINSAPEHMREGLSLLLRAKEDRTLEDMAMISDTVIDLLAETIINNMKSTLSILITETNISPNDAISSVIDILTLPFIALYTDVIDNEKTSPEAFAGKVRDAVMINIALTNEKEPASEVKTEEVTTGEVVTGNVITEDDGC